MFSNMVQSLIEHERIKTTDQKAKELRKIAEKTITWATSVGSIDRDKADAEDKARIVHAMRMAGTVVKQRPTLEKLFSDIGPRFVGRPGGYTRIMKIGSRAGDAAKMSIIELVDFGDRRKAAEEEAKAAAEKAAAKKGKKAEAKSADDGAAPKKAKAESKPKAKKKSEE